MEAIDWLRIPEESVSVASLRLTRDVVAIEGLQRALRGEPPPSGDPVIHVVRYLGHLYVDNGHCRVMVAMLRGNDRINARVVNA